MKNAFFGILMFLWLAMGIGATQDKMIITFKDGRVEALDTNAILKIEYKSASIPIVTTAPPATECWAGHFAGSDTSGYDIDISLVVRNGVVEGGYSYYHKAQRQNVTAVITNTVVEGDVLRGKWRQTTGVIAEGKFEWRWLPNRKCAAFEGTFDGTKYWSQMARR
jgi:hypothetical protein